MKKASKTAKALAGGNAAFGPDGAWAPNVCKAIRLATEKYAAIVAKIANRQDDKNAGLKEVKNAKKGSPEYTKRSEQIVGSILDLEQLRSQRTLVGGLTPQIVRRADKGDFNASMSPQEIYDAVVEDAEAEGGDEESDAGDGPQMRLTPEQILPSHPFSMYAAAIEGCFGEHSAAKVDEKMDGYIEAARTPLGMARHWARHFSGKEFTTKDRRELLHGPEWLKDGIRASMAAAAAGTLCPTHDQGEREAADMVRLLTLCAEADASAWIDLAGGKDTPLNKATLAKKTA